MIVKISLKVRNRTMFQFQTIAAEDFPCSSSVHRGHQRRQQHRDELLLQLLVMEAAAAAVAASAAMQQQLSPILLTFFLWKATS